MLELANPSPNKKMVLDFLEMVGRDARAAFLTYALPNYRQHNQTIGDGPDCAIAFFEAMEKDSSSFKLHYMIEEDDKVVTFASRHSADGKPLCILVDMFRIEEGKLAEHWDVAQRVTDLPFRKGDLI